MTFGELDSSCALPKAEGSMMQSIRGLGWHVLAVLALILNACTIDTESGSARNELTVLLDAGYAGAWPAGLDPATNTTARANLSMMNAIYGGLFQLTTDENGDNTRVTGVLARDYEFADEGRTLVIHLREDLVFSDGTPFDADAVRYNIERNLASPCSCAPRDWPWVEQHRVSTSDPHTVQLHFTRPYSAAINAFPVSNVNWIASPAALETMGAEQFKITPVGAGPFRVVENQLSSRLVLERNARYWEAGRPYLDRLIFQPIGNEQTAYQALIAGDAQIYEGMTSPSVIKLAIEDERVQVTLQPATSPYVVQLNTLSPPFDDQRAREAIYYATKVDAIREGLFNNWYPVSQSFTGPGSLFHVQSVPGYRTYDLQRARAIVEELGGLHVMLGTLRTPVAEQIVTALQTQWEAAGIEVSLETYDLPILIQSFRSGEWQAILSTVGSYDPEAGSGLGLRFGSEGTYSGVRDPDLDRLLAEASGSFDAQRRHDLYSEAAKHISDNAYAPFLFAFAPAQVATPGIRGPGLTTKIPPILVSTGVLWQDVESRGE